MSGGFRKTQTVLVIAVFGKGDGGALQEPKIGDAAVQTAWWVVLRKGKAI